MMKDYGVVLKGVSKRKFGEAFKFGVFEFQMEGQDFIYSFMGSKSFDPCSLQKIKKGYLI